MVDKLTPERRSENMRRIKSKDMKPEVAVRRLIHALGYRYRLHRKDLPGKPDIVFGPRRKAVFVHGCFWHQHSGCGEGRLPRSNTGYWKPKLARNVQRDAQNVAVLREQGWDSLIVWECETKDLARLRRRLVQFLK